MRGRLLVAACAVALLAGCAKPRPPLYLWESFPRQQYDALQRGGAGAQEQIAALEEHVVKARAQNAALPPGLRAHLGMLKLSIGDPGEARQLWLAEKLAFPESAPYMDQLLKRLDGPAAKTEKPA